MTYEESIEKIKEHLPTFRRTMELAGENPEMCFVCGIKPTDVIKLLEEHTLSLIDSTIERLDGEIEQIEEKLKEFHSNPLHPNRKVYLGKRDAKHQELTHWKELKEKLTNK